MSDKKCFVDLTDVEQGALMLAWHRGSTIQQLGDVGKGIWYGVGETLTWSDYGVYRVKPTPIVAYANVYHDGLALHKSKELALQCSTGAAVRVAVKLIEA